MRAAILTQPNAPLAVQEVVAADLGAEDVLVETGASGLCHSDLSFIERADGKDAWILGHEGAGRVVEVGSSVTSLEPESFLS